MWAVVLLLASAEDPAPGVERETAAQREERERAEAHPQAIHAPLTPPPNSDVVEAWGNYMEDFVPSMLLSFMLPAHDEQIFYHECNVTDYVRGAYFASNDASYLDIVSPNSDPNVEMSIFSPAGKLISRQSVAEGIFYFEAGEKGTYAFHLHNKNMVDATVATLTLGVGTSDGKSNTRGSKISEVDGLVSEIMSESQYLWIRQQSHLKSVGSVHSRVVCFAIIEMIVVGVVAAFQVYYIMGVISDRRLI
jgi:hypothetical protein